VTTHPAASDTESATGGSDEIDNSTCTVPCCPLWAVVTTKFADWNVKEYGGVPPLSVTPATGMSDPQLELIE